LFLTAAISFKKGFSTRTLSEFGREPLLLVLNFQLNPGHPQSLNEAAAEWEYEQQEMPDLAMSVWFDQLVFEGVALPDAPGKVVVHSGGKPARELVRSTR
jgi:hypothetical protein